MTVEEMKKKEEEYLDFMDRRDCEITFAYPGVSVTFTHMELARDFIEIILNDMFCYHPRAVMSIHNKDGEIIADVELNWMHGAEKVGAGLYEIGGDKLDYNHCIERIFEIIDKEEVA